MLHHSLRFLCCLFFVLTLVSAQRITTTNAQGLTVVATPSIDDDGDTVLRTITTIGRTAPTSVSATTTRISTTTSGFTTRSHATTPTVVVSSGTILDYSSYRSRVDAEVSSISVSRVNAYLETATTFGLKVTSGCSARSPLEMSSLVVAVAAVCVGLCWSL